MQEHTTIAAIATPPGQGGIAVVRLSGPESYAVAAQVFRPMDSRKRVADAKGYTALYGQFADGAELFDDGIALFFRAPHSYTGEDAVELSCHGGDAVACRLVEACLAAGAVPAGPGEYTRRALLNGKLSLTQAEAVMDLISAGGRQGAALANAARGGALAQKIAAQQQALTSLQAHLTAWVDFPEEDVPALEAGPLRQTLSGVRAALDELIGNYNAAAVLASPPCSTCWPALTGPSSPPSPAPPGTWWSRRSSWGISGSTSSTPPACGIPTTRWRPRGSAAAGPSWPRPGWCWPSLTAPSP